MNRMNQDDHKKGKKNTLPSMLRSDSFCQSPVQQHLFIEQSEKSPEVMIPESQAGRKRVVRSSLYGQRPRGGQGALHWWTLLKSGIKRPANDKSAHFTGACPYLVELGITQEAPHRIVIDVTVPTQALNPIQSHLGSTLC